MSLRALPMFVGRRLAVRMLASVLLATAVSTTVAGLAPTSALASSATMESQFVQKMNAAREAAGLHPYVVASDLTAVARDHSAQMAEKQSLYHNPDLTTQVKNWQAVGENVGEGPTVDDIHNAFMQSPEHRANILDHDFTQVGVGVTVDSNGIIWVTEDFREPMQSATTTTHHSSTQHPSTTTQNSPTRRTGTTSPQPVAASHTASAGPAPSPSAATSPQAKLMAKLAAIRTASQTGSDPVASAFDYLNTVTALNNA